MKKIIIFFRNYRDNREIYSEYLKLFNKKGFKTEVFDFTKTYLQENKIGYVLSVLKAIRDFEPDFIYVADEIFSKNVLLIALARKIFFYKYKITALVASQYVLNNKKGFINKIKSNFLIANVDVLFCRNKKELQKIKAMDLFKKRNNISQLYLGAPREFFYKINQPREEVCSHLECLRINYAKIKGKYILSFIGRITPEKGLLEFLECFKKLPDNFALLYAGRAEQSDYFNKICGFVKNNNLENRVVYLGYLAGKDLKYFYNVSDLVIMPTTQKYNNFLELFGSVIPESILCKTLIIGSDNGSIPEVINRPDLIFKEGDIDDLLRVINYVYELEPAKKDEIINNNYEMAQQKYSAEAFVGAIIKAIS